MKEKKDHKKSQKPKQKPLNLMTRTEIVEYRDRLKKSQERSNIGGRNWQRCNKILNEITILLDNLATEA